MTVHLNLCVCASILSPLKERMISLTLHKWLLSLFLSLYSTSNLQIQLGLWYLNMTLDSILNQQHILNLGSKLYLFFWPAISLMILLA